MASKLQIMYPVILFHEAFPRSIAHGLCARVWTPPYFPPPLLSSPHPCVRRSVGLVGYLCLSHGLLRVVVYFPPCSAWRKKYLRRCFIFPAEFRLFFVRVCVTGRTRTGLAINSGSFWEGWKREKQIRAVTRADICGCALDLCDFSLRGSNSGPTPLTLGRRRILDSCLMRRDFKLLLKPRVKSFTARCFPDLRSVNPAFSTRFFSPIHMQITANTSYKIHTVKRRSAKCTFKYITQAKQRATWWHSFFMDFYSLWHVE